MTAMRAREREFDTIRIEQDERVLIARIEAPPYNFMTSRMQGELNELTAAVDQDESVGAVIVTGGVPGRYITHFDIGEILAATQRGAAPLPATALRTLLRGIEIAGRVPRLAEIVEATPAGDVLHLGRFNETLLRIMRSPAVYIAAVNGPCGGGGLESAVCFDVRVAARDSASFMLPELLIGLTTTFGGQRLTQLVGPGRALEILLEARAYSAQEALEMGLVGHVVGDIDLLDVAHEMATRYATRNRDTIAAQKRILNEYALLPPADALRAETAANAAGMIAGPATHALRAFVEMQSETDGDSAFLTNPDPWRQGAVVDLNKDTTR